MSGSAPTQVNRYPVTIAGETALVGSAAELAVTLDVLQGQYDRMVLAQLRPHLAEIVGGPLGLLSTLRSLAPDDQLYLIDALAERLPELIGDAGRLRDILALLADESVEARLLATLGADGLRRLIVNAAGLAEVLQWIYGACDRQVLDLLGPAYLRRLLNTSHDLSLVLHAIDFDTQAWLLDSLEWERVAALSGDGRCLARLLRALPSGLGVRLLDQYTPERLVALIGNELDWQYLCRRLEAAELECLCQKLGVQANA